ncbi:excalibur calcium-binding domain-containing protein [Streptomyces sp. NPDC090036]|uniref:excalibur calcium-binding domain-containing protein n=1 Tax=Streptomyces sp. NPDC090036 TaxID=3365926 RepID=UPI00382AC093
MGQGGAGGDRGPGLDLVRGLGRGGTRPATHPRRRQAATPADRHRHGVRHTSCPALPASTPPPSAAPEPAGPSQTPPPGDSAAEPQPAHGASVPPTPAERRQEARPSTDDGKARPPARTPAGAGPASGSDSSTGSGDSGGGGVVSYRNCTAVRAAHADPIRRGDPGFGPHLDRDGDGIACE